MSHHHDPFAPRAAGQVDKDPDGNGRNDHLDAMRKPELVNLATTLGLDATGNRGDLITRVRAAQAVTKPAPAETLPRGGEPEQPALDQA